MRTSLPAAMVTILPDAAILLETTVAVPSVHPDEPPRLMVRISTPALTPIRRPSTITETKIQVLYKGQTLLLLAIIGDTAGAAKDPVHEYCRIKGDPANVKLISRICSNDSLKSKYSSDSRQAV
jgi:hypothetical protein